jgi:two-component system, OmpR family, KDP operon response regulator KdpE
VLTEDATAAHILVVEDDRALREVVVGALGSAGYETSVATHGITASQMLRDADGIDIVLLDIGLPFVDGWQILQQMEDRRGPAVIVISARGEETDKVRALDLGADDYLAKPFGAEELLARVRAVLRRVRSPRGAPGIVVHGAVRVDLGARTVTRGGAEVRLSPTEWELLAELARNAGVTLDHRTLLQRVWGPQYADERNYLRTFAQRLRAKLEDDPAHPEVVVTAGRQGYRFGPPR